MSDTSDRPAGRPGARPMGDDTERRLRASVRDGEELYSAFEVVITRTPSDTALGHYRYRTQVRGLLTGIVAEREGVIPMWDIIRVIVEGADQLQALDHECAHCGQPHSAHERKAFATRCADGGVFQSTVTAALSSPYAGPVTHARAGRAEGGER